MKWKYLAAWCPGVLIAIFNGLLREYVLAYLFEDLAAHQVSAVFFILLFGIYVWYILPWLNLKSKRKYLLLGVAWSVMTLTFEIFFGYFVMGYPWPALFYEYNIMDGRLWRVVLIWTLLAPVTLYTFKESNEHL